MKVKIQSKNGMRVIDLSRRKAIRERCLNCTCWSTLAVKTCDPRLYAEPCSLHPFRTGTGKHNAKDRAKAIRDYCLWCVDGSAKGVAKCTSKECPLFPYRLSTVDRLVEMPSSKKKRHIEAPTETHIVEPIPQVGIQASFGFNHSV